MLQDNFNGICVRIFCFGFVERQGFGKDATLDSDIAMFFEGIEEEAFDTTCAMVFSVSCSLHTPLGQKYLDGELLAEIY
jgi:hypothetical protein